MTLRSPQWRRLRRSRSRRERRRHVAPGSLNLLIAESRLARRPRHTAGAVPLAGSCVRHPGRCAPLPCSHLSTYTPPGASMRQSCLRGELSSRPLLWPSSPALAAAQQMRSTKIPNVGQQAPEFSGPASTRYGLLKTAPSLRPARQDGRARLLPQVAHAGMHGADGGVPRSLREALRRRKGCRGRLDQRGRRHHAAVVGARRKLPDGVRERLERRDRPHVRRVSDKYSWTIASPSCCRPDGKITYRAMPFKELTEGAYSELASAVASASHATSAGTH